MVYLLKWKFTRWKSCCGKSRWNGRGRWPRDEIRSSRSTRQNRRRSASRTQVWQMSSYASSVFGFTFVLSVALFGGLVCYILAPTISPILDIVSPRNETRARNLGFDLDYGVDMQTYWFWLWLHTSVTGVMVIFNIIASDLMFITFNVHTCYMFAIVK